MKGSLPDMNLLTALCQGNHRLLDNWVNRTPRQMLAFSLPVITLGCALYGGTMGLWHGWQMAGYVAIKLPCLIFFTLICNAALNGMLAIVLGSGLSFRQSMQLLLTGFTVMAIILASLSPVTFFMGLSAPEPDAEGASSFHSATLLMHVGIVAYAGIVAHACLLGFVRFAALSRKAGTHTFFAWIAGNLFVGAQFSWVLRPFFGSPGLEVQFLRDDPMRGTFYEAVYRALQHFI